MKTLKTLKQLALLAVAIFIGVYACSHDAQKMPNRNDSALTDHPSLTCKANLDCGEEGEIYHTITREVTHIELPFLNPGCRIKIQYVYQQCMPEIVFRDFTLSFDSDDCGFNSPETDFLAEKLEKYLRDIVIREAINLLREHKNFNPVVDVRVFKYICFMWCKRVKIGDGDIEPDLPPMDGNRQSDGLIDPTSNNSSLNDDNPNFEWVRINCGEGCCITKAKYSLNHQDELILLEATTEAQGDCLEYTIGISYDGVYTYECHGDWDGADCANRCYYPYYP